MPSSCFKGKTSRSAIGPTKKKHKILIRYTRDVAVLTHTFVFVIMVLGHVLDRINQFDQTDLASERVQSKTKSQNVNSPKKKLLF